MTSINTAKQGVQLLAVASGIFLIWLAGWNCALEDKNSGKSSTNESVAWWLVPIGALVIAGCGVLLCVGALVEQAAQ